MKRDVFQAIADPTRRAILLLLALQAMTPNALAEHFSSSRQAISKHLQILVACQLVTSECRGREISYAVVADKMQDVEQWLQQFKHQVDTRFNQLDEVLANLNATTP